ncbi:hypothetical protein M3625_12305 [Paenibacillus sp. MER 78]|nr:hypothetical protein [Paenibacillus sp. MER 78]
MGGAAEYIISENWALVSYEWITCFMGIYTKLSPLCLKGGAGCLINSTRFFSCQSKSVSIDKTSMERYT